MIIELQPNTFNDLTTLAGVAEGDALSIEYWSSENSGATVSLALLSTPPTSTAAAQAKLICDDESWKSVRTIQGVAGSKVYAWISTPKASSIKVAVG